jgi:phage anti-repressor protein/predicted GIY-YIG superfamily endonuclease
MFCIDHRKNVEPCLLQPKLQQKICNIKHMTESKIALKFVKRDIVKLFTNIPHDFVDDFYDILESKNGKKDAFPIDLELLAKWLGVRKNTLVKTLKSSYNEGEDYLLYRAMERQRGGYNKNIILITVDTFKRMCMRSKSEKAEMVRTYFIELDNFLEKYATRIMLGILKKLNKSEKTKRSDGSGWIYIFKVKNKIYKIGQTSDLIKRLQAYQTGRLEDVRMIATYETQNRKKAEQCVKSFIEEKRLKKRKELYEVNEDIIKRVMKLCGDLGDNVHLKDKEWNVKQEGHYYILFSNTSHTF